MEFHIRCEEKDIARYVLCSGSYRRAKLIADQFDEMRLVSESRGYQIYSGKYDGVFMTAIGTGMGGPALAIALEELGHLGADAFIRVGSCGVLQPYQNPGDVIISGGAYRGGGTAHKYLPPEFPAVPSFKVLHRLITAAEKLDIPVTVGIGISTDAFYAPRDTEFTRMMVNAGVVAIEMENDTLFVLGSFRGWRTGAICASDGAPGEIKPEWGQEAFLKGEEQAIRIALHAMVALAENDKK